jgi:hypothetical protein
MMEAVIVGLAVSFLGTATFVHEAFELRDVRKDQRRMMYLGLVAGALMNTAVGVAGTIGLWAVETAKVFTPGLIYDGICAVALIAIFSLAYLAGELVAGALSRRLVDRYAPFWDEQE